MDPKALLDELMGRDRDLPLNQQKREKLRYDSPEVCHYYLAAFCPNDLFPNTRSDLGPCPRVHDDGLKEEFAASDRVGQYEGELLAYLDRLIADLERKIKRCHERLEKELPLTAGGKESTERASEIGLEIQQLLKRAEEEGEKGLVDEAQATMAKVEGLKREKEALVRAVLPEFLNATAFDKERRMVVCEVCGAMQASTDTDKRLSSHLEGKQHLGYFLIRQTAEQLRKKREEEREKRRQALDSKTKEPSNSDANGEADGSEKATEEGEKSLERKRSFRRERSRSPSRERERRSRERERERERDRERGRERERESERERGRERPRESERGGERSGRRDRYGGDDGRGKRERDYSFRGEKRTEELEEEGRDRRRDSGHYNDRKDARSFRRGRNGDERDG